MTSLRRPVVLRSARTLLRGVVLSLSIVVTVGVVARYTNVVDRYFIFFPDRTITQDPGDVGLEFDDVFFSAADGVKLHGWFVPGEGDTTLVWFHGNAGNISHRVGNVAELHTRLGVNVFIFDYRGYGKSDGDVSEKGTYLDADGAMSYLRTRGDVDQQRLVLFGRSLGGAVAAEAATKNDVYALVLESAFSSVQAMARRQYPFLPGIGAIIRTKYATLSKLKDVHAPVMVLHGDRDETVPIEIGRELFEAANPPKRFYTIEGAGHNDTYIVGGPAYFQALAEFIEDPTAEGGGG